MGKPRTYQRDRYALNSRVCRHSTFKDTEDRVLLDHYHIALSSPRSPFPHARCTYSCSPQNWLRQRRKPETDWDRSRTMRRLQLLVLAVIAAAVMVGGQIPSGRGHWVYSSALRVINLQTRANWGNVSSPFVVLVLLLCLFLNFIWRLFMLCRWY